MFVVHGATGCATITATDVDIEDPNSDISDVLVIFDVPNLPSHEFVGHYRGIYSLMRLTGAEGMPRTIK